MTKKEKISKETIDHLSKLALLDLSEEEKEKLSKQLGDIINYFKKLGVDRKFLYKKNVKIPNLYCGVLDQF